jgi:biofilm PGA synthesis N-glycosyltransferase PgaC
MAHVQIAISITEIFLFLFIILYLLVFVVIVYGWSKLRENSELSHDSALTISVIIAARNEEEYLPLLLKDLASQTYPSELTEIIIADDHSDKSIAGLPCVKSFPGPNLRIVRLSDQFSGKKQALLSAARLSKSELLLFTDADCRVGIGWINSFTQYYRFYRPGMIMGLVDYTECHRYFQKFFRLEFLALVVSGAGTASLGFATMCNGANMAVERKLYLELSEQLKPIIPSGDDVFLLHALKYRKEKPVVVNRSESSVVTTKPPITAGQFINQRARWISKSPLYTDRDTLFFAIGVLITNLCVPASFLLVLISGKWGVFISVYAIKTFADCLLIGAGLKFFKGIGQLVFVPFLELIYPVYILIVLIPGFMHAYTWKGRRQNNFIQ